MIEQSPQKHNRDIGVPNVIHGPQNLLGIVPLYETKLLLWPCWAWSLTMPVLPKDDLDPFARLMLELAALGVLPRNPASYPVALPPDLFQLIARDLCNRGYLTADFRLSEEGKGLVDARQHTKPSYLRATILSERISGRTLPFIISGSPKYCVPARWIDRKLQYKRTPTDSGYLTPPYLKPGNTKPLAPKPDEVLQAYNIHRKISRRSALCLAAQTAPPTCPDWGDPNALRMSIIVEERPEPVYLACTAVIPSGQAEEILVTDGFGLSFSRYFSETLQTAPPAWFSAWLDSLPAKQITRPESHSHPTWRYPEITSLCADGLAQHALLTSGEAPSSDAISRRHMAAQKTVSHFYAAIERALSFAMTDAEVSAPAAIIKNNTHENNIDYLSRCAAKLGFDTFAVRPLFSNLPPGKIDAVLSGSYEMAPLLALSIATAVTVPEHPISRLAQSDPALLTWIQGELTPLRNSAMHAASLPDAPARQSSNIGERRMTLLQSLPRRAFRIISELLPDIRAELSALENSPALISSDASEQALKCRNLLREHFDYDFLRSIPEEISASLRALAAADLSLQARPCDEELYTAFVVQASSALEQILRHASLDFRPQGDIPENLPQLAAESLVHAGFADSADQIPLALLGANNRKRLERAVQGCNSTLGPYLIALAWKRPEAFHTLRSLYPQALDLIVRVIKERGHGNRAGKTPALEQADLSDIYTAIKHLINAFHI